MPTRHWSDLDLTPQRLTTRACHIVGFAITSSAGWSARAAIPILGDLLRELRKATADQIARMLEFCIVWRKAMSNATRNIGNGSSAFTPFFLKERMLKLRLETLAGFILCHSLAVLALCPWFFSWTGVFRLLLGILLTGVLGRNVGFHRLLTHRRFKCPLWFEHTLALLGTCALQFSPAYWVAVHRRHHHFPDQESDPHSPARGFLWAHLGWVLVRGGDMKAKVVIDRHARDLVRDPLYVALERNYNWIWLPLAVWLGLFALGFSAAFIRRNDTRCTAIWL